MKGRSLFFVFFLLSCFTINPANHNYFSKPFVITSDNFIEVRVDDGKGSYGFISLNLTYDGLICRNLNDVCFIKRDEIDSESLIKLQIYLNEINPLKSIESSIYNDTNIVTFGKIPLRIFFTNSKRDNKLVKYEKCNPKLEKIIILVNQLVPIEYREKYKFGKRC